MKQRIFTAVMFVLWLSLPAITFAAADLTWTANVESDLAGYKIYRGNVNGAGTCPIGPLQPLLIGGVPASVGKVTTYKDTTVPVFDGALCYEITAFDTANNESTHSNRATAVVNLVPPPAPSGLSVVVN